MTRNDFKEYYLGTAYLMKEDEKLSKKYLAEITKPWMIHSLKASTALLHKDRMTFRQEADKAISSATGLQKYTLHHMMKRMESDFL